ncbi:hypothetical protein AB0F11_28240 [Streptomyces sp. NPDC032472]|uniref:hypothetical protein n=1 Tax=Streptomyces sp. NPDC032472 TaxID=3155018 RepID=UPI0034056A0F
MAANWCPWACSPQTRRPTAYLTSALAARGRHEPADQLAGLADDLGHLRLALSQAAAYLVDVGLDCATYRHWLADRARILTDVLPDPSGLPDDQATNVAAAWSLSIDSADDLPTRESSRLQTRQGRCGCCAA